MLKIVRKDRKIFVFCAVLALLICFVSSDIWMPKLYADQSVVISAVGEKNRFSESYEIWINDITVNGRALSFEKLASESDWKAVEGCLLSDSGNKRNIFTIQTKKLKRMSIRFGTHGWSGIVEITSNSGTQRVDLYTQEGGTRTVTVKGERLQPRVGAIGRFLCIYVLLFAGMCMLFFWNAGKQGIFAGLQKRMLEKISGQTNTLLLSAYLFGIWYSYFFVNAFEVLDIQPIWLLVLVKLLFLAAVFLIAAGLLRFAGKLKTGVPASLCRKKKAALFLVFFTICLSVFYFWQTAFYPGAFSPDSIAQYSQAVSGDYQDWHPVWHTILFFKLPLKITGKVSSIVFFQLIVLSLALAHMLLTICEYAGLRFAVIALGCILFNPLVTSFAVFPWKDIAFAAVAVFVMCGIVKIYCSGGRQGTSFPELVWLAVCLSNATLFRHNAILFTVVVVVVLFFYLKKKQWIWMTMISLLFLLSVKGLIYPAIGVEKPGERKQEVLGLPLTVLANVTKECPWMLDEQTADFMYAMAPQKVWEEGYVCGDFNSVKWTGIDRTVIEETSVWKILKMTVRCFFVAPEASWRACLSLTDVVYAVEGEIAYIGPTVSSNDFGIRECGNEHTKAFLNELFVPMIQCTGFKYLCYVGTTVLAMLTFLLAKSDLTNIQDWKKIALCLPVFVYDVGTMLLLTGSESRFFYINFLIWPLVVLIAFGTQRFEETRKGV